MVMPSDGYSLKEIIDLTRSEQTAGFASLTTLLGTKADKADVENLRRDLVEHRSDTDKRLTALEADKDLRDVKTKVLGAHKDSRLTRRQKVWGSIGAVALILATTFGPVIANHIH